MTLRAMASSLDVIALTPSPRLRPPCRSVLSSCSTAPRRSRPSAAARCRASPTRRLRSTRPGISRAFIREVDDERDRADGGVGALAVPADQLMRQREVERHQRKRQQQDPERADRARVRLAVDERHEHAGREPEHRRRQRPRTPVIGAATRDERPQIAPRGTATGSATASTAAGNSRSASTSLKTALYSATASVPDHHCTRNTSIRK